MSTTKKNNNVNQIVNDFNNYERVGGTMIGGGTLLGLSNLLTGINDFDTIIE